MAILFILNGKNFLLLIYNKLNILVYNKLNILEIKFWVKILIEKEKVGIYKIIHKSSLLSIELWVLINL